jgi:hypothetical protein
VKTVPLKRGTTLPVECGLASYEGLFMMLANLVLLRDGRGM